MPIATEQLARLPIIIIINHANFMVFSGTAGGRPGQGAAGAPGPGKKAGLGANNHTTGAESNKESNQILINEVNTHGCSLEEQQPNKAEAQNTMERVLESAP